MKEKGLIQHQQLISIIIVVYNAGTVLEETLLSVLNQNCNNVELILIDGNSTDNTISIIKKYEAKIAYWISEPDQGVYDAMNKGAKIASGKFIYFLGAGDKLLNVIDELVKFLVNDKVIYYGNVYRSDLKKYYDGRFSQFKLSVKNICHQAIFYPAEVFKKYNYNITYKMQSDHDLNMRINGDKNFMYQYIPITISSYQGGGISDNTLDHKFHSDKLKIIKSNFNFYVFFYAYLRTTIAKTFKLNAYNK
ncbi:MAG: glycosyltransferase [Rickettsiales bacterium]|nr:MAG: glycosyltransferase [Rickettsiales bacterium]